MHIHVQSHIYEHKDSRQHPNRPWIARDVHVNISNLYTHIHNRQYQSGRAIPWGTHIYKYSYTCAHKESRQYQSGRSSPWNIHIHIYNVYTHIDIPDSTKAGRAITWVYICINNHIHTHINIQAVPKRAVFSLEYIYTRTCVCGKIYVRT